MYCHTDHGDGLKAGPALTPHNNRLSSGRAMFKTLQNLVKTPMNLLKNLHMMNFRLFHGLKLIQNYFKTTIIRKI